MWEHHHKCKTAPSAQYSSSQSPHRCNKFFLPANRRRTAHLRPGIKGDISSQNCAFQYSGSSVQYQDSTCYELPRSAPEHHLPLGLVATSTARILRKAPQYLPAHTARHYRAVPDSPPRSLLRPTGWYCTQLGYHCATSVESVSSREQRLPDLTNAALRRQNIRGETLVNTSDTDKLYIAITCIQGIHKRIVRFKS
jgi:hypothetical protein